MGRHTIRKSSFSTKRLAVAGMAALALGAVAAPAANAAPDSDWDRLAECESGGDWHINTGNGFQGGLQFSPSTWSGYGGDEFAPSADQASREEQIVVAERVLEGQGWGAWPSCSAQLGLNSAPEQRSAPGASTGNDYASNPQEAAADLSSQTDTLAIDGVWEKVTEAFAANGVEVPTELESLYKANRTALNDNYTDGLKQAEAAADQYKALTANLA
ncbi:resuscitation-promoting factor Rpf1 domain-containing protein [Corynebacterium sp.]|uniref:resuscitation-promoting factor Rpf1 domain-containing protein n=1 Tax=Corynebacterium sp. TaxID=1720 RepID=UPI0025BF76B2|nr:resuscitation-promoting factor Rpf1 domain-containing protein [Corynebacterium sp.]